MYRIRLQILSIAIVAEVVLICSVPACLSMHNPLSSVQHDYVAAHIGCLQSHVSLGSRSNMSSLK